MTVVESGAETARSPQTQVDAADGLADRYAKALFEFAEERSILPDVLAQVRSLVKLIGESASLRDFLANRTLDVRQTVKALDAVLAAQGFGEAVRHFGGVVARNRRLPHLAGILTAVLAIDARRRGEMVAEVRSAQPLTPAQRAGLQARLAEAGYARVAIVEQVAPELIGGLVVRIGAKLFDTSIRGRLARMQNVMKGAA
ncbi:ATP synthase F1 subunit delta [Neoasaia chiangmaiensis]|uniref:ATP synthase subunit delta n=1 Tax=Neoasaia chiangmaiensis TaxID=320497 RepID=A0A1U9KUH1_9PROT|nr:ATP synthase F1 subunit delta [Neoasaia chiangmaiensis]AQS89471.1 ATP synthase F0F1 subunit delta [Neoasaia chiangmaiensis]